MTHCARMVPALFTLLGETHERLAQVELLYLVRAGNGGGIPQLGAFTAHFPQQATRRASDFTLLAPAHTNCVCGVQWIFGR